MRDPSSHICIGLMSGTSLDGVDGVLAAFPCADNVGGLRTLSTAYVPFPDELRAQLLALQNVGTDEIHREAMAANALATHYAACVSQLLAAADMQPSEVHATAVHGQTIRHRPELGYTRQTNNPALLAELTGIDVIADFRSRDIAAGGQGAPLVPAFHQAVFGSPTEVRVVANIGGIANISVLDPRGSITGFDTGPGNVLMDAWISRHQGVSYDANGAWAAGGQIHAPLLNTLMEEPYLHRAPPKSTGRDLFHREWLAAKLVPYSALPAEDVQATLTAFTAASLSNAIRAYAPEAQAVYVCGGGAYNATLMRRLQAELSMDGNRTKLSSTAELGVEPNHVEALAFAWLAHRYLERATGNVPNVTGAKGDRILGALYPA